MISISELKKQEDAVIQTWSKMLIDSHLLPSGYNGEQYMKSIIEKAAGKAETNIQEKLNLIMQGNGDITGISKQALQDYVGESYNKESIRKMVPGENLNNVMEALGKNIEFALDNIQQDKVKAALGNKFENELTIALMEILQGNQYKQDIGKYMVEKLNGDIKFNFIEDLSEEIKTKLQTEINKPRSGDKKLPAGYSYQTNLRTDQKEFKTKPVDVISTIRIQNVGAQKDRVDIVFSIDYETINPTTKKTKSITSESFNIGLDAKRYSDIHNIPKSITTKDMIQSGLVKGNWTVQTLDIFFDNFDKDFTYGMTLKEYLNNTNRRTKILDIMMNKTILSYKTGKPTLFFVVNNKCYRASELWGELLRDGSVLYHKAKHYFWYGKA